MANTPNVGLPTMDPNVLQPSIPFNAAMQLLDAVAQIVVVATANTPPSTTTSDVGKVYLIDSAPTGAWAGRAGQLALCTAPSLWAYLTPRVGWYADIGGGLKRLSSSGWVAVGGGSGDYVNRAGDTMTGQLNAPKVYSSGDLVAALTAYAKQFQARFAKGQDGQADQTEGWLLQTLDADGNSLGGIYANASGLSLVNNKGNTWNQVQLLNDGQILLNGRSPFQRGYIDGALMTYAGQSAITVGPGSCYIPGAKTAVEFADIAKSGLSLSASTWYHLYIYLNGTTPDVEVATTAPSAPYIGRARSKSGDSSRRYVGSIKTDASGAVLPFIVGSDGAFRYLVGNNAAPLRCLANGKATSRSTVSLSQAMPVTATGGIFVMSNTDSSVYANLSVPGAAAASVLGIAPGGALAGQVVSFPTDANQAVDYYYSSAPTNGLYVDVVGFTLGR